MERALQSLTVYEILENIHVLATQASKYKASVTAGWENWKKRVEWGQVFPLQFPDHLQKTDGIEGS